MKKSLIALAILGAASGAALAQSSVTLFGVADFAFGKATSMGDKKWHAQSGGIVNSGGGSELGFTGREDLGGGWSAGFMFSTELDLRNGATISGAAGTTWNRSAWVSIGNNNLGTLTLGRNYTPGFMGQAVYELTHWSYYSALAATFGFGGNPQPRNSAQIKYISPSFGGLSTEIAYISKGDGNQLDNGTDKESSRWALNVVYNQGPIKAAITADKSSHSASGIPNANKTNWTVGGSYTFNNMFAVSASYNRTNSAQHWQGELGPRYGARRYGWELGASFFSGPYTVTLDLTRDTKNDLYGGKKYTNGVLEGRYALSKRTYLYGAYLRLDGDNNYGIGINHKF
jgi:predicted porin